MDVIPAKKPDDIETRVLTTATGGVNINNY